MRNYVFGFFVEWLIMSGQTQVYQHSCRTGTAPVAKVHTKQEVISKPVWSLPQQVYATVARKKQTGRVSMNNAFEERISIAFYP